MSINEQNAFVKALLAAAKGKPLDMELPALLPALPGNTQAICTEVEKGKYWEFALYWLGINLGKVCVSLEQGKVRLEQLA